MKSPKLVLKRWLHPIVFAIWAVFPLYLSDSRRYVAFLRPEFGLLLAIANYIALGFMFAALMRPKTIETDLSDVLRAFVLLVPVLYSIVMPDTTLSDQAFKKRFIGTGNVAIERQASTKLSPQTDKKNPDSRSEPGDIQAKRKEAPPERTILQIFRKPNFFKGQRVMVTGMILRDEQLKPYFGGGDTAVYRFLINCCAADAIPLAIALDSDQADAFGNKQWVQVDGIFDIQQINDKPVPVFLKPLIKPVKAPAVPYPF